MAGAAGADWDYVFLSPIFPSISKPGHAPSLPPSALADTVTRADVDVLALGGVCGANAGGLPALGFRGAALLGCVWAPGADAAAEVAAVVRALETAR